MSTLCIIPARGGSKGIPKKNIVSLAGHPLLAWTVHAARHANIIDRVVVSTDSSEIADVAIRYGAEVVMRPEEISGDSSPSELAVLHVLDFMAHDEGYKPDVVAFLQCTSPLTTCGDLDAACSSLLKGGMDVVFSAVRSHAFLWRCDANRCAVEVNHDRRQRLMRQHLEPEYRETGAFYFMRGSGFVQAKKRFFGKVALFEVPESRAIDIDSTIDLLLAELLLRGASAPVCKS